MKGTLFGDLPEEKGNKQGPDTQTKKPEKVSGGSLFGAMPPHLKPAMAPVSVKRSSVPKKNSKVPIRRQVPDKTHGMDLLSTPIQNAGLEMPLQDAYDPSKPNDFEQILQEKERMRLEKEAELETLKRKRMERKEEPPVREVVQPPQGPEKGMTLAQKMLEKMGWKKGEGLGKTKQGIPTALVVEKTDTRSGRVILPPPSSSPCTARTAPTPHIPSNPPSRVIMLTNIVGPGQVDESLDEEVGEECSKYGEVDNVLIFEVTDPEYPPDQAVRIFVQFEKQTAATAALQELHGRYFAGRVVSVDYFDEERFNRQDLAPNNVTKLL